MSAIGLYTFNLNLRIVFIGCFVLGVLLGVFAMLHGVERAPRATVRRFSLNLPTIAGFATVFGLAGFFLDRFTTLSPARGTRSIRS